MQFDEALRYLLGLGHETLALKLGLRTTELLLRSIGDPQTFYPSVQIAGTNGKGSTAVVLESICRAAGIKTGLLTSPHLISITERIRIDGRDISQVAFARLATRVREGAELPVSTGELEASPTFFEQMTAIALLAFRQAGVHLAILETGLGGRLDSTTVARAETVAITPIALDHQEYLGETLAEIAAEKAAIIRPRVTAIIGPQSQAALDVIRRRCESVNIIPRLTECDAKILGLTGDGRLRATFETSADSYREVTPGLRGRHQVTNISLAIQLAESLRERGFEIPHAAIIQGIEQAEHPGRLELWEGPPRLLFDGAHNPAGVSVLGEYLDEFVREPITLVFGAMRDKNLGEMASLLFPRAHRLILTQPDNPRAAGVELLRHYAADIIESQKITLETSAGSAIRLALDQTPADEIICVTGSLYLIGEIQAAISHSQDKEQAKLQASEVNQVAK